MGTCIFCGRKGKLTLEHVFPERLNQIVPFPEDGHISSLTVVRYVPQKEVVHDGTWREKPFNRQAKCVCKRCNDGWMQRLDGAAEPFYAPMMRREPTQLNRGEQKVLAHWAAKMFAVLEFADRLTPAIPRSHRYWIYRQKEPPPRARIWLAQFKSVMTNSYTYYHLTASYPPERPPMNPNMHFGIFTVGALAVFGFGTTAPVNFGVDKDPPGALGRSLGRLWPIDTDILSWPPGPTLDDNGMYTLASTFKHARRV